MSPETFKMLDVSYQKLRNASLSEVKECATEYARQVNCVLGILAQRLEILERKLNGNEATR